MNTQGISAPCRLQIVYIRFVLTTNPVLAFFVLRNLYKISEALLFQNKELYIVLVVSTIVVTILLYLSCSKLLKHVECLKPLKM